MLVYFLVFMIVWYLYPLLTVNVTRYKSKTDWGKGHSSKTSPLPPPKKQGHFLSLKYILYAVKNLR